MSSLFHQMAVAGQTATAAIEEESFTVPNKAGLAFMAKLQTIEDIVQFGEIGVDPRATHFINIRKGLNIQLNGGDVIFGMGTKFTVLPKIDPNSAVKVHNIYQVVQVSPQDN